MMVQRNTFRSKCQLETNILPPILSKHDPKIKLFSTHSKDIHLVLLVYVLAWFSVEVLLQWKHTPSGWLKYTQGRNV